MILILAQKTSRVIKNAPVHGFYGKCDNTSLNDYICITRGCLRAPLARRYLENEGTNNFISNLASTCWQRSGFCLTTPATIHQWFLRGCCPWSLGADFSVYNPEKTLDALDWEFRDQNLAWVKNIVDNLVVTGWRCTCFSTSYKYEGPIQDRSCVIYYILVLYAVPAILFVIVMAIAFEKRKSVAVE